MKRSILIWFSILTMILVLSACGDKEEKAAEEGSPSPNEQETVEISDEEKMPESDVIAKVEDEEVTGANYNLVYTQLKLYAVQTGQDQTDEELKDLSIDSAIDRQVLLIAAEEKGITFSEDDAKKEVEELKKENKEAYETILDQYQLSEAQFTEQLQFEMVMDEYMDKEIKVEVSNEDVEEFYEEAKKENDEIPELNEIRDTLKKQIESQERNKELEKHVEDLKKEMDIEVLI